MKDIDQLIEQMHQAGRQRLESDCTPHEKQVSLLEWASRPLWRYAAAVAALVVAGGMLLLLRMRRNQPMPDMAHNELPYSVKQQLQEALEQSSIQTIKHSDYAFSESSDGVRVYCDNNCNADEVLARMEMVIKTLL